MDYCERNAAADFPGNFSYVVTSLYRKGNPETNPHAIEGNAMDFTLRWKGSYAQISYYNELFKDMFYGWPFRAGIDNTYGNIHIHIDLGNTRPDNQVLPYFFKEDNGKFQYRITHPNQIA